MATYLDKLKLAQDGDFQKRLRFAFAIAAVRILASKDPSPARVAWATAQLSNKTAAIQVQAAATLCAADPNIGEVGNKVEDGALQGVVDANLDFLITVEG